MTEQTKSKAGGPYAKKGMFFEVPLKIVEMEIDRVGKVRFREMSGADRDQWENFVVQNRVGSGKDAKPDTRGTKALAVVLSVLLPDRDEPMFTKADIPKIQRMSGTVLSDLFDVVQRLNKLSDEDVEEMEGNSDGEGSDITGSASLNG